MQTGHEILTCSEIAAADRAAIAAGTPGRVLMERAGEAVATAIMDRWAPRPTVVLCGPGNNGGDGFVVARLLVEAGWAVRCVLAGAADALPGDAALAYGDWTGPTAGLSEAPREIARAGLVVDALFGAGLARPLTPALRALLQAAETAAPLAAIDLPSGLDGDTGRPLDYAPRCALTVTFHRKKPAHVLMPGRDLCGEVVVADIGLAIPAAPKLFENAPALWLSALAWPGAATHKHARGRLVVVSGAMPRTGAARLAARAGLRIGAGVVTVLSPPDAVAVHAGALDAVMVAGFEGAEDLAAQARPAKCAVIGPAGGVGAQTRAQVEALSAAGLALVIDADVFSSFAGTPEGLFALIDEADVLTPHVGEFERIFPGLLQGSASRIEAVRQAARLSGAVVLLKGPDTTIAAPDGRVVVNTNASPWLATAGSGDVLAGFIGGIRSQWTAAFESACAAAWIHGEAGTAIGAGLIAEDLPEAAGGVLRSLSAMAAAAAGGGE